jgi:cytochrome b561
MQRIWSSTGNRCYVLFRIGCCGPICEVEIVGDSTEKETRYGAVSQAIHWITVVLVVTLLLTGLVGDVDADEPGSATFMWHGSLGVLVFALAIVRIALRVVSGAPAFPATMNRLERGLARAVHVAFYVLLFALPVSGWLAASAEGASVNFFGMVTLPRYVSAADTPATATRVEDEHERGSGERRENFFKEAHEVLGYAILVLAILHALAALKHHVVDRDDVLRSMLPRARRRDPSSAR